MESSTSALLRVYSAFQSQLISTPFIFEFDFEIISEEFKPVNLHFHHLTSRDEIVRIFKNRAKLFDFRLLEKVTWNEGLWKDYRKWIDFSLTAFSVCLQPFVNLQTGHSAGP